MLQVLTHTDLSHQAVFVSVHTSKLTNVGKNVLQTVSQLECIDVTETILDVRIDDQLGQAKNLTTQVEGVTETRLLSFLGRQGLYRLQVEVVIKVKIVEILSVDQKVQHVVTLATNLKTSFHPIELGSLEELRLLETAEEVLLVQGFGWSVLECVQDIAL